MNAVVEQVMDQVQSEFERIQELKSCVDKLSAWDKSFAMSLLSQYSSKGRLSVNQWPWVAKLIDRAQQDVFENAQQLDGDFAPMLSMFKLALQHLKRPGVKLLTDEGRPLYISIAGERARCPGTLNVTSGGGYGSTWYGRMTTDGRWAPSQKVPGEVTDDVTKALKEFAADPVQAATAYGKKTGRCCFCNLQLTTPESTAVGYGPICADHYGLVWGKEV